MRTAALPLLVGLPLVGCVLLALLPGIGDRAARLVGLVFSGAAFLVSLGLLAGFDYARLTSPRSIAPQYEVDWRWISAIDVRLHLGVDGISLPLVALTALLSFLCMVYTLRTVPDPGRPRAFVALVLLLEVGMLGTFVALDLLVFFVAFEIVLVPMYFLIAVWGGGNRAYASMKFILFTLFGSALMLLGFFALYLGGPGPHTFDMVELAARGGSGLSRTYQLVTFLGLFIAFAIKTPMWPLHTWLPDAHTEAPTVGSVLLAGVLLKMGTYGFVRIALPELPTAARAYAPYLGVLAVVGIIYGSLACLGQRNLKRLIAFSSVGHMGFVLLGIATLTPVGINAALYGNIAHGLITGMLFFLVGALRERYGTYEIPEYGGGVLAKSPHLGSLLTYVAIASLGLPGLAGFWGEMLAMFGAFRPAADLPRGLFLGLMVAAGIGTILTAAYFLWMLSRVNLGVVAERRRGVRMADAASLELLAWAPLLALVLTLGLYPRVVFGITDGAVRALFQAG